MAARSTTWDGADPAVLVHQLELHQAELEAQNHELRAMMDELGASNQALTVARDRYRGLYDRSPIPYVTIDRERTIREANRTAEALFGTPRERLIGATLDLFIDELGRRAFRAFVGEVFAAGHARSADLIVTRDGLPADAPAVQVLIDGLTIAAGTGGEQQAVLALVDISARKALENARRKAQDEVLAVVSHDLRGPLNAIVLACDALRSGLPPDELADCVTGIERAATRCTRLIKDLLGVVRIESGALVLDRVWFDLGDLARALLSDYAGAAAAAGCALTLSIGEGRLMLLADRDRVHQIGSNLLANALVHARGTPVELSVADAGDAVVLAVTDQGPGVPLEEQPRVFDRFRQAGRGRMGAGLGLAIVKGLVTAHRGTVGIQSTPGLGARFEVTLPRGGQPPGESPPVTPRQRVTT